LIKSGASYIKLKIPFSKEEGNIETKLNIDKDGTFTWKMEEPKFKNIDKKEITVKLKKKKFFLLGGPEEIDKKTSKLTELGTKCEFIKEFKMKNNMTFTLKF
jgi:hypothetical protein